MFTTYFHERCSTARRLLRSAHTVDAIVSAWGEVSLGWITAAQLQKPADLVTEYEELDRIMTARSDVGPSFGGSHCGVWAMSLHFLPRDELQAVRLRLATFALACVAWANRPRSSD